MRKCIFSAIILLLMFSSAACSSEDKDKKTSTSNETTKELKQAEIGKLYDNPKKYKGYKVDFYARIFIDPEQDGDGTYIQAYANDNSNYNTIIGIDDPDLEVKDGDIIHVTGKVKDEYKGENMMGATIIAPAIKADKIEVSDYATAFAPAIKTINVNKTIDQHGYSITLQKIETAKKETRAYISIKNNTQDSISFYSFNAKLLVNSSQMEKLNEGHYEDIQSDILPGVQTEGVLAFPKIPDSGQLKLHLEGSSDNFDINIDPFEFTVIY
ncbi:hypothetical protein [Bacillus testis]|uniref:hypothetical protein n=1 Tax=Bacillus testis TaxID=1622072 RepID=UPI00067F4CAB|nr:hypothetical protein [Bacillus testis]